MGLYEPRIDAKPKRVIYHERDPLYTKVKKGAESERRYLKESNRTDFAHSIEIRSSTKIQQQCLFDIRIGIRPHYGAQPSIPLIGFVRFTWKTKHCHRRDCDILLDPYHAV